MPYQIEDKFVTAVASSALFDLTESDSVFRTRGEDEYRQYQREHETDVINTGVAFPLIKRLLSMNGATAEDQPVEVVLLSRNDPDTGLRVFKSIEHYKLPISRAVFVAGRNPFQYMEAFNASLFLSGNPADVKEAVERGFPAGCIYPTDFIDDDEDHWI
ncbi:5'-nucleotidase [Paenibacillus naphthalenovorans]|nr:5'-nucleotidase [Paenibacillus naphthalenovorans]